MATAKSVQLCEMCADISTHTLELHSGRLDFLPHPHILGRLHKIPQNTGMAFPKVLVLDQAILMLPVECK